MSILRNIVSIGWTRKIIFSPQLSPSERIHTPFRPDLASHKVNSGSKNAGSILFISLRHQVVSIDRPVLYGERVCLLYIIYFVLSQTVFLEVEPSRHQAQQTLPDHVSSTAECPSTDILHVT
jgi:hypothetical protein